MIDCPIFGSKRASSRISRVVPGTIFLRLLAFCVVVATTPCIVTSAERNTAEAELRLSDAVKYLSSDELEGRGIGSEGLNLAAEYIARQFRKAGLKTDLFDGSPFQEFELTTDSELGPKNKNKLSLIGPQVKDGGQPQRVELEFEQDFNTLAVGGSGKFDLPIVFVGYGITAKKENYDDYAGIDVKGKIVVMLRKEPQQNNPHSVFNGNKPSQHAYFTRKIANAYEHGAAAIIIVNDKFALLQKAESDKKSWQEIVDKLADARDAFQKQNRTPTETAKYLKEVNNLAQQIQLLGEKISGDSDEVLAFKGAGVASSHRNTPVFFATRASFSHLITSTYDGADLQDLETAIDNDLTPRSRVIKGWRAVGESSVIQKKAAVKNVIAVLEGNGPYADETVIVGAHYDHLGLGGSGSLAPWTKEIHNGADDNASGTSVLLEVARNLALQEQRPSRRIVFIAFTGEELGLLGSAHYVLQPPFSLQQTVAMINMDMVGRLKDNKLIVHGTGTADELDELLDKVNDKFAFTITKRPSGFGPSDHTSFYTKKIPVLHLFTGTHSDYHRPSDDFEKINVTGMQRISGLVGEIVASLAQSEQRPQYKETKRKPVATNGGDRPYFGSIPDFSKQVEGYALGGVASGGPAARAGMKSGDVIVKFGDSKIGGLEDIDSALRKFKAGDKVLVVIIRDGKQLSLQVTLEAPR